MKLSFLIKNGLRISLLSVAVLLFSCNQRGGDPAPSGDVAEQIDELLAQMTLEEKVGQMTQITVNMFFKGKKAYSPDLPVELHTDSIKKYVVDNHIGSVFGGARFPFSRSQWDEFITELQTAATEDTRMKIPLVYGIDAIHGVNFTEGSTIFPQQIGMAATWNPELVKRGAEITAYETKASCQPWNFAPVLGLGRQPLWSRFFETFGEDVLLVKTMGTAMITGMEGDDVAEKDKVAACMKHYLGYSVPVSGKDRTPAMIPERQLREYFLPPFKAAVDAGVHTVMINSGEINGIPVHCDKYLLTSLLRDELGFEGVAVTDFTDILLLHKSHKVAASYKEAIKMAINAGIDMSMTPKEADFCKLLVELVNEGEVPMSRIDEAVRRILKLKFDLGLFENPVPDAKEYEKFGCEEHRLVALQQALESITLLKNDNNTLPLNKSSRILVTGPTANSMIYLNGPWTYTWQGNDPQYDVKDKHTVFEAIDNLGRKCEYVPGTSISEEINIHKAVKAAKKADVIVACVGETPGVEEKGNINDLNLPAIQKELVKALSETGKPVVLVVNTGRPRIITDIIPIVDAVVMAYLPGNEGGDALAQLLFGEENFSGKLPFTWPKYAASLAALYDHKFTNHNIEGEIKGYNPLYEFGFGLSYTEFGYDNLTINKNSYSVNDTIVVSVEVENIGLHDGMEVVQVYVSDHYATVTPPAKRLRAFRKIQLESGESKTVSFAIPVEDLAFVGIENEWIVEPGTFTLSAGSSQIDFSVKR